MRLIGQKVDALAEHQLNIRWRTTANWLIFKVP